MNLKDKTVVVTGASKGIGKALCLALLEKGAKVAGWCRSTPVFNHPNFVWIHCDVADEASVIDAYNKTLGFFPGTVDVLVNNAGWGAFSNMDEQNSEDWINMFNVNVHGIYYCTKLVLPDMKAQKAGHIINIASIAGLEGIAGGTAYCGTKHAVRGISHALYKEVKADNVKVTCIYPGSVHTDFFNDVKEINANDTMLHAEDVATMIVQTLETPDNYNTMDIEIRPMNPQYS